ITMQASQVLCHPGQRLSEHSTLPADSVFPADSVLDDRQRTLAAGESFSEVPRRLVVTRECQEQVGHFEMVGAQRARPDGQRPFERCASLSPAFGMPERKRERKVRGCDVGMLLA